MNDSKTKLTPFALAYLTCALWSSTGDNDEPLDTDHAISDLAPETLQKAIDDCAKFETDNRADIDLAALDSSRAGHCFWLNRNGHGSGFWDEYSKTDADSTKYDACQRLSDASDKFGSVDLYIGDDGKIYS